MENLEKAIEQVKRELPCLELYENEPMKKHCSFKIGGPVRALALPSSAESLMELCRILKEKGTVPMLLGNGSNILFPDEGLRELFIIGTGRLQELHLTEEGKIYCEAGVSLSRLSLFAQQQGLQGLEFASGIPGSLGGACMMNAGAYGGELKDCIESVRSLYLPDGEIRELSNRDCCFCYRGSRFKKEPGHVILSAVLSLKRGDSQEIAAAMRELNARRREKQPLELPSAGSAFKRPEGHYAARLIEEAGLKGYSVGGAQVSEKHAGFVVNTGEASSADVLELLKRVRKRVYENSGIVIEPEIILLPPDYRPEERNLLCCPAPDAEA